MPEFGGHRRPGETRPCRLCLRSRLFPRTCCQGLLCAAAQALDGRLPSQGGPPVRRRLAEDDLNGTPASRIAGPCSEVVLFDPGRKILCHTRIEGSVRAADHVDDPVAVGATAARDLTHLATPAAGFGPARTLLIPWIVLPVPTRPLSNPEPAPVDFRLAPTGVSHRRGGLPPRPKPARPKRRHRAAAGRQDRLPAPIQTTGGH